MTTPSATAGSPGAAGSAVDEWLRNQLWLYESWAKHGPGCRGFHAADPEKQRRDLAEVRDWLRIEVAKLPNDGTQRPGDAEVTNATRATPPGSLE